MKATQTTETPDTKGKGVVVLIGSMIIGLLLVIVFMLALGYHKEREQEIAAANAEKARIEQEAAWAANYKRVKAEMAAARAKEIEIMRKGLPKH